MATHLIDSKRNKEKQAALAEKWATEGTGMPAWDKRVYQAATDPSLRFVTRIGRQWWQTRRKRAVRKPVEKQANGQTVAIWVEVGPSGDWRWHVKTMGTLGASAVYDSPAAALHKLQGETHGYTDRRSVREGHSD